jgi:dihydroneopterin aldolase
MSEILISGLRVRANIGVPDEERAEMQELEFDLHIHTTLAFEQMEDTLSKTIDYAQVCQRVSEIAAEKPRNLIETLADEVATTILAEFAALRVEVELRKFILPETRHVSVRCNRVRG